MSTPTLTPPAPPTPPQDGHGPARGSGDDASRASSASRVIAVLVIALGVVIAIGVAVTALFSTIASASVRTESRTLAGSTIGELDVDVSAGSLRVRYGDVNEATLQVTSGTGAGAWTFERNDATLKVASPESPFGLGWWSGGSGEALLTLPAAWERSAPDADFELSAGALDIDGDFADVDVNIGAGSLTAEGTVRTLSVDLSAGRADLDLTSVATAEFTVSAGAIEANFAGDAPRAVSIDVSAGSLELTLPDDEYAVRAGDTTAGQLTNRLVTSATARSIIDVQVSAGSVELIPAG